MRWWRSLRVQLAVVGFFAIYVPVLVLLGVAIATEDTEVTGRSVDVATSGVETESDTEVVGRRDIERSPWVTVTAIALAPVAAGLSWWLAGRAVRSIDEVRRVAEDIEATDLSRRIELDHGSNEVRALAASFDAMLDRLEAAADTQRRLVEEASHELRTPLSVLTTNADVVLAQEDASADELRAAVERSRTAAARMRTALDELLVDARGRARTIVRRPADVVALVRDAVTALSDLAAAEGSTVTVTGPASLNAPVDSAMVDRAVRNLVENAIRHAPGGAKILVEVAAGDGTVRVAVTDDGPGIPVDDQANIFDRFWRGSTSDGSGLGLPIAAQIARAHGGDLTLSSPHADGRGTRIVMTLGAPATRINEPRMAIDDGQSVIDD